MRKAIKRKVIDCLRFRALLRGSLVYEVGKVFLNGIIRIDDMGLSGLKNFVPFSNKSISSIIL